jgi:hypothetical protein
MRVLDADRQGADWRDVSRIVLRIDPDTEADRARLAFESHPLACQMDDRARLSPFVATRLLIIATPALCLLSIIAGVAFSARALMVWTGLLGALAVAVVAKEVIEGPRRQWA